MTPSAIIATTRFGFAARERDLAAVAADPRGWVLGQLANRPHVTGRFADMLLAVARHPAMGFYLDNVQSIGPNSPFGRRRDKGLNENLGREILELHTLGVDGGYTQKDVEALARILTGWTIARLRDPNPGSFRFAPQIHEPGEKTLLGRRYAESGVDEGEAALRDLAHH